MAILIKRYANRKLYNTDTSRYITLKGIAKLLEEGEEVRVMDNETGEDITQVALSQILVDNERAKEDPSETLLSQILSRGGDVLYGAIRKSVDEATDGLGDFQDRLRRMVHQASTDPRADPRADSRADSRADPEARFDTNADAEGSPRMRFGRGYPSGAGSSDAARASGAGAGGAPDAMAFAALVRKTVSEVLDERELPHRKDIENLTRNLERVAIAVERLESVYRDDSDRHADREEGDRLAEREPEASGERSAGHVAEPPDSFPETSPETSSDSTSPPESPTSPDSFRSSEWPK